jgi:hypothetical protein
MSDRLQNLINKNYSPSIKNSELMMDVLKSGDIDLIEQFNSKILTPNDKKIALIHKMLNSEDFKINNVIDFFKILSPLNVEYNFGFTDWNFKEHNKYLLIQNSVLKNNNCILLNRLYLNPIKKILDNSNVVYDYYEFSNKRAHKQMDIIFVVYL